MTVTTLGDSLLAELVTKLETAREAVASVARRTPLSHSVALSEAAGCEVYLKCEHLQYTGSFKFRGAINKLTQLGDAARRKGVTTGSTGNHGQALALAGRFRDVDVTVYAAETAAPSKLAAISALGAKVVTVAGPHLSAELEARRQADIQGKLFVPPYNDLDVIAGQGTLGLEILDDLPGVDAVYASVGGGGLICGIGAALRSQRSTARIVGCWPAASACLHESISAGQIVEAHDEPTLSDGTAGGIEANAVTLPLGTMLIDRRTLVTEAEIIDGIRRIARSERWMIEGAAGVAVAGLLAGKRRRSNEKAVVVLCGRNIALDAFLAAAGGTEAEFQIKT